MAAPTRPGRLRVQAPAPGHTKSRCRGHSVTGSHGGPARGGTVARRGTDSEAGPARGPAGLAAAAATSGPAQGARDQAEGPP